MKRRTSNSNVEIKGAESFPPPFLLDSEDDVQMTGQPQLGFFSNFFSSGITSEAKSRMLASASS